MPRSQLAVAGVTLVFSKTDYLGLEKVLEHLLKESLRISDSQVLRQKMTLRYIE